MMTRKVVVAPLDWGLGHATRCIPIIRALLLARYEVHIGGAGMAFELLRQEFPSLKHFSLPAYSPTYPREGESMVWQMIRQLPHFAQTIDAEHRVIDEYVERERIGVVISDNRYGCWSNSAHSVFITHQSNVLMPKRFGWLALFVRYFNKKMARKFDVCWIPDRPGDESITGKLTSFGARHFHPRMEYIGHLSRLERKEISTEILYDVLAICSGPEPQRSMLEEIFATQLAPSGLRYLLVRGVIEDKSMPGRVNYLTSGEMADAMAHSAVVISRSGYSTIMDLSAMGKKAIFIPTPGQTEQEYLARSLRDKGICFSMSQKEFQLKQALQESEKYSGFKPAKPGELLHAAIAKLESSKVDN